MFRHLAALCRSELARDGRHHNAPNLTPRSAPRSIASNRSQVEATGIVTKSVKGVYQKHGYMNNPPAPKICIANPAN